MGRGCDHVGNCGEGVVGELHRGGYDGRMDCMIFVGVGMGSEMCGRLMFRGRCDGEWCALELVWWVEGWVC